MLRTNGPLLLLLFLISFGATAETAQDHIEKAKEYIADNEPRAGIIELKNALQKNPKSIDARLTLGNLYLAMGDSAAAEKELERAKKLNAEKSTWILPLTTSHLLQGKFRDVLKETEDLQGLSDELQSELLVVRGDALLRVRQLDDALKTFERARQLQPAAASPQVGLVMVQLANNEQEKAKAALDNLLKTFPDNNKALTIRGELLARSKDTEGALKDFTAALKIEQNNIPALFGRASIHLGSGNWKLAKPDIEQLDTIVPGHPRQNHLKAVLAFLQKDYSQAERHLQDVLKVQPDNRQSQQLMGVVSFAQKKYQTANEYLTKVNTANPNHLPTIKLLATIRNNLNKTLDTIALLEPAVKANPGDAQLKAMLGSAYMKARRFSEGSKMMGEAIKIEPNLAAYRTQLAMGLLAQGKTSDAIEELQSTVDMGKDFMQADVLLVLTHLKNKDPEKALKISSSLEKKQPNNPVGFNLSGLAHAIAKNYSAAEASYRRALEIDKNFTTGYINLARLESQQGHLEKARQHYESGLKITPENTSLLIGLAELANEEGDKEKMHALLARAMEGTPSSPQPAIIATRTYLQEGKILNALNVSGEASRKFPDNPAVLELYGRTLLMSDKPGSAVSTFQRLVELSEQLNTLSYLAMAQTAAKQPSQATATYKKILKLQPEHIPAHVALIKFDVDTGKFSEALAASKRLQQAHPNSSAGFQLEGMTFAVQKQHKQAITGFTKAMELNPNGKLAVQLARQYFQANDIPGGEKVLNTWIAKEPKDIPAHLALGMSLQSTKKNKEALEIYEKILSIDDKNLIALNNLAWLYSLKGDQRALKLGKKAYSLATKAPAIVDTYGWILVQSGDLDEGARILKEAVDMAPKHQEIIYHLGFAQAKQGEKDDARITLQKVIRIDPTTNHAKQAQTLIDSL